MDSVFRTRGLAGPGTRLGGCFNSKWAMGRVNERSEEAKGIKLHTAILDYTQYVYNVHLKFQTSVSLRIPIYGSRNLPHIARKMDYMCPF